MRYHLTVAMTFAVIRNGNHLRMHRNRIMKISLVMGMGMGMGMRMRLSMGTGSRMEMGIPAFSVDTAASLRRGIGPVMVVRTHWCSTQLMGQLMQQGFGDLKKGQQKIERTKKYAQKAGYYGKFTWHSAATRKLFSPYRDESKNAIPVV